MSSQARFPRALLQDHMLEHVLSSRKPELRVVQLLCGQTDLQGDASEGPEPFIAVPYSQFTHHIIHSSIKWEKRERVYSSQYLQRVKFLFLGQGGRTEGEGMFVSILYIRQSISCCLSTNGYWDVLSIIIKFAWENGIMVIVENSLYQLELSAEIFEGEITWYLGFTLKYLSQNQNKIGSEGKSRDKWNNWQNTANRWTGW